MVSHWHAWHPLLKDAKSAQIAVCSAASPAEQSANPAVPQPVPAAAKEPANAGGAPRRWAVPPWAKAANWEPPEVRIVGRPLNNSTGMWLG